MALIGKKSKTKIIFRLTIRENGKLLATVMIDEKVGFISAPMEHFAPELVETVNTNVVKDILTPGGRDSKSQQFVGYLSAEPELVATPNGERLDLAPIMVTGFEL